MTSVGDAIGVVNVSIVSRAWHETIKGGVVFASLVIQW